MVARGSKGVSWQFDLLRLAEWRFAATQTGEQADPEAMTPAERKAWYEGETRRRDLAERAKELIPVAEVERVCAEAFAALAQDIRAVPDLLERRHAISPEIAAAVERALDAALASLASRMEKLAPVETN